MLLQLVFSLLVWSACGFQLKRSATNSRSLYSNNIDYRLYGVVGRRWGDVDGRDGQEDEYDGNTNEPTLREMFPKDENVVGFTKLPVFERLEPDWTSLEPDDPLFLDMPWPTESGPESAAFARHVQWKRRLSDGERIRWQKWAIYERLQRPGQYDYAIEDYVKQSMVRTVSKFSDNHFGKNQKLEGELYNTIRLGFEEEEKDEVSTVIKSWYSAFNRRNYDELRLLLLPGENTSCKLPGCNRVKGSTSVFKLYKTILMNSKPLATTNPKILSISVHGFIAVAQIYEDIRENSELSGDLKRVQKGQVKKIVSESGKAFKRKVHSTMVLRKYNQQWRILSAESIPFLESDFLASKKLLKMMRDEQRGLSFLNGNTKRAKGKDKGLLNKSDLSKALKRKGFPPEIVKMLTESVSRSIDMDGMGLGGIVIKSAGSEDEEEEGNTKDSRVSIDNVFGGSNRIRIGGDGRSIRVVPDGEEKSDDSEDHSSPITEIKNRFATSNKSPALPIDDRDTLSKQTIQALRFLVKSGAISKDVKDALMLDMIQCINERKPSMAEKAYRMLVYGKLDKVQSFTPDLMDDILEEYAEQCILITDILRERQYHGDTDTEGEGEEGNIEDEDSMDDVIASLTAALNR